ncbi:MAG: hypothetical protein SVR04_09360 [Spirochaetota bacterium]|nr:hypothetical protein [Spirochaetota bacterium]
MKKVLTWTCLLLTAFQAGAEDFFNNQLFSRIKNDYVVYVDNRYEHTVLHGIQYLGGDTYLLHYFNFDTGEEHLVSADYYYDADRNIRVENFSAVEGEFDISDIEKITRVFMTLINLEDRIDTSRYPNDSSFTQTYTRDDIDYRQTVYYKYWVPLFQMHRIELLEPDPSRGVQLMRAGRPGPDSDGGFREIKYLPQYRPGPDISIEERELGVQVEEVGIGFSLDDRWVRKQGGLFLLPLVTEHDAAIQVRSIDLNDPLVNSPLIYCMMAVYSSGDLIPAFTVQITQYENAVFFKYEVFSESTGAYTTSLNYLFERGGGLCDIFTLNAFSSVLEANIGYFNGILETLDPGQ